MRVTTKGQITIPKHILKKLDITANTEVDFLEEAGKFYLVKVDTEVKINKFKHVRGIATIKITTDTIMSLTRDA